MQKLTEREIATAKPGMYADAHGLYLQVSPTLTRSWIFRYSLHGRRREMGLGSLLDVPAVKARQRVLAARQHVLAGVDPIEQRRRDEAARAAAAEKASGRTTFRAVAEAHVDAQTAGWRNAKHAQQWRNTLATYVYPILGDTPVDEVTDDQVLAVLEPIWKAKTETATRVRSRIENVLDAAAARKLRRGDNPARWRGHLEYILPDPRKVTPVRHHPALPYVDVPTLMIELRERVGMSALALEFVILTATRSGETRLAEWRELDLDAALWTIPASRTKTATEHRVPLSLQALAVLVRAAELREGALVFPGARKRRPLSDMALTELVRGMRLGITVHGFRSTFRDWTAEQTTHPAEVAEMALGHAVGDKVEAAYRRGDMFERRRALMDEWAAYLDRLSGKL